MPKGQPKRGVKVAKNLGVSCSGEVEEKLKQIANKQGWSKSYLVEQVLRVYLDLPSDYTWADLELVKRGILEGQ